MDEKSLEPGRDVGTCPVVHLDFSEPKQAGTYWRLSDEMREEAPAYFNTFSQGYWIFTQYDAVKDIFRDPELFSSASFVPWEPEPGYHFIPTQVDPPDHVKYRQLLNGWFSPGSVEKITPRARQICHEIVEEIAAGDACEFTTDFALRFPTEVFCEMVGLTRADASKLRVWVDDFFRGHSGNPEYLPGMAAALESIGAFWEAALAERAHDTEVRPGDLASHLMHSKIDGRDLSHEEQLDILTVLVLAGLDTTKASLGFLFLHLAEHPEDLQKLLDNPALVPSAVEESLRYYAIIFNEGRKVTRDAEFHGCQLKKGDMVCPLVAGANRDPRVYDHAGEFLVDRQGNQHLGFGAGPHRCLGAHLARRLMAIALEEWLAVIPSFTRGDDRTLIERGGGAMLALNELPLTWSSVRTIGAQ